MSQKKSRRRRQADDSQPLTTKPLTTMVHLTPEAHAALGRLTSLYGTTKKVINAALLHFAQQPAGTQHKALLDVAEGAKSVA